MNKIILVGAINEGNVPSCGETMKNQLFVKRFNELFDKVITVDTLNWKKRPWVLARLFFVLLFNRGAKVIISASGAASYLISFLYYIPLKKNVYFWVVGGDLAKGIEKGIYNLKSLAKLNRIIVQGQSMVNDIAKFGLTNTLHVPNSKPIEYIPQIKRKLSGDKYRFVFLSRIHPQKGIKEIFEAIDILNKKGYANRFIVDLYGKMEPSFVKEFESYTSRLPNMKYNGFLNLTQSDGYKVLSSYDVMLFPTYWGGEGFPGVVLDANISGLPIIATDWNMNTEVIEDGKTGFIIPIHDSLSLATYMEKYINGEINLYEMRKYCIKHVKQYDYRNVISNDLMLKLNLIS